MQTCSVLIQSSKLEYVFGMNHAGRHDSTCRNTLQDAPRTFICPSCRTYTYLLSWCHNPAAAWTPDCSDFEMLKQHQPGAERPYKSLWGGGGSSARAALIGRGELFKDSVGSCPSSTQWQHCDSIPLVCSGLIKVVRVLTCPVALLHLHTSTSNRMLFEARK